LWSVWERPRGHDRLKFFGVIEKLMRINNTNENTEAVKLGLIVDVETTGLEPGKDKIIEIGMVQFVYDDVNTEPHIVSMYGGVQDPHFSLSPEIVKLTGLTDQILCGQEIDWMHVALLWQRSSIVIAHNASFDRDFIKRVPELAASPKHWACSVRHIDWEQKGFGSRKLNYLAADHGFVNVFAHRALFDCATTFRLIKPHLRELIDQSFEAEILIKAFQSPFESKDVLKGRKYRWDGQERVWSKTVLKSKIMDERKFLESEIYRGPTKHEEIETYFNSGT
jgi:DNA polymerase III subunit epsilon